MPNQGYVLGTWLSQKDKIEAFKQTPRKILICADLKHPDTELLLRLHHQHFEMGRAASYTQPLRSLAYVLVLILRNPHWMEVNFAIPIYEDKKKFAHGQ